MVERLLFVVVPSLHESFCIVQFAAVYHLQVGPHASQRATRCNLSSGTHSVLLGNPCRGALQ